MYKVSFVPYKGESNNFLGYCNVVADDKFRMTSISVLKSNNSETAMFLSMPAYFTGKKDENDNPVFKDYFYPLDRGFRNDLMDAVKKTMEIGEPVEFCRDQIVKFSARVKPVTKSDPEKDTGIRANVTVYLSRDITDKKADIVIDSFHIREALTGDNTGRLFIAAPSKKNKSGEYNDICFPITKEFRDELYGLIMYEYYKEIEKGAEGGQGSGKMSASDIDLLNFINK